MGWLRSASGRTNPRILVAMASQRRVAHVLLSLWQAPEPRARARRISGKEVTGKMAIPGAGHNRLVTVFGGSGFVGRHVVRQMAKDGWRIRVAVRRPDLAGHLQPMGAVGQIAAVQANLRYPKSVASAIHGADAVINLAAVLANSGKQTLKAINVEGARNVAKAAREAGIGSYVHLSAMGADPKGGSNYARSRAAGEAATLAEMPEAVILRPSLIFGPEDEFFNRFAAMAQISPFLPLIGGGRTRFQPIYVTDVASAVLAALDGEAAPGTIYELGGPEVLNFRKLLEKTIEWSGHDAHLLPIPIWMAKLMALLTWPLPNSWRPLTVDQVRLLKTDSIVSKEAIDEGRTLAALGIEHAHTVDLMVPQYLESYRPKGQYSHYRG